MKAIYNKFIEATQILLVFIVIMICGAVLKFSDWK